jgi:prenyltransferase beta subunit
MTMDADFLKDKHRSFLRRCLQSKLPRAYQPEDGGRLALLYFTLSACDLLGVQLPPEDVNAATDWIYAQQCPNGGFRGSPACGTVRCARVCICTGIDVA